MRPKIFRMGFPIFPAAVAVRSSLVTSLETPSSSRFFAASFFRNAAPSFASAVASLAGSFGAHFAIASSSWVDSFSVGELTLTVLP